MNHNFYHQKDLPLEIQILNISVNMGRMANWAMDIFNLLDQKGEKVYQSRINLISKLKEQTYSYMIDLESQDVSLVFRSTLDKFQAKFEILRKKNFTRKNYQYWAEEAFTWANILQHRAKLA